MKLKILLVLTAVMLFVPVSGCGLVDKIASRSPEEVARNLGIKIPVTGTSVKSEDPRFQVLGSCAGLEFLLPESEWREHVGHYYDLKDLQPDDSMVTSCGANLIECLPAGRHRRSPNYEVSDTYRRHYRGVSVFPNCLNGLTKVAWVLVDE